MTVPVPLDTRGLDARDASLLQRPIGMRQQSLNLLRLCQLSGRVQPQHFDVHLGDDVRQGRDGTLRSHDESRQQEIALAREWREGRGVEGCRDPLQLAQVSACQLDADYLRRLLGELGDDVRV